MQYRYRKTVNKPRNFTKHMAMGQNLLTHDIWNMIWEDEHPLISYDLDDYFRVSTMWDPQTIAKFVQIIPITTVYDTQITN